ncbi:MAG: hypothetical protein Q9159_000496 [Coniocarpon cinnabarinum]
MAYPQLGVALSHHNPSWPLLIVTALLAVCALCIQRLLRILYSPLRHIPPAHPSAPFSSLWINYVRHQFHENHTLLDAHRRLGDVIRLGPNEISVNSVDNGLRTVYAGGFEKPDWYPNLFTNYDGVEIMFSTMASGPHSARKRMMTNVYAKSYLQSSPVMTLVAKNVIYGRLLPLLQVKERMGAGANIRLIAESVTMDIVTGYLLGYRSGSNFLRNPDEARWWLTRYQSRKAHTFWPQEMPKLTNTLARCGIRLSPKWVSAANHDLEAWCLRRCDDAENILAQSEKIPTGDTSTAPDHPVVYAQLRTQLEKESLDPGALKLSGASQRLQIASEMLDHLSAGHETSGITLTFLFYELSIRPCLQSRLRAELQTLNPPISLPASASSAPDLPSAKSIDSLPLLHAVVMETLRRHPAIPGPQPRVTPKGKRLQDNRIGPYAGIPAGVRISANAYCLHHNPDVFPNPDSWIPERWLNPFVHPHLAADIYCYRPEGQKPFETQDQETEFLKDMHRWFWAFGSGGRMCIGSNLAMLQMKAIVASVVSCFRTELISLDERRVEESVYELSFVEIGDLKARHEGLDQTVLGFKINKELKLTFENQHAWSSNHIAINTNEPVKAPQLGQQDTYTAQPLAESVNMRFKRWDEDEPVSEPLTEAELSSDGEA